MKMDFEDYTNGGYGFNFTGIHDGSAHQIEADLLQDYSTAPATTYSVFNRTNST